MDNNTRSKIKRYMTNGNNIRNFYRKQRISSVYRNLKIEKNWRDCREIVIVIHFWWKYNMVQPLQKGIWRYIAKLSVDLLFDLVIQFVGIYPKDLLGKKC